MARALVLSACALILAACQSPSIEGGQAAVSAAVAPVVVAAREAVPTLPPQPVLPVPTATPAPTVYPGAVDLIVQFEVSSPGYYGARLACTTPAVPAVRHGASATTAATRPAG